LFFASTVQWVARILQPPLNNSPISSITSISRLQTIVLLGVAAAALYALLWILVCRSYNWTYKEGESLPQGWHAIVLSLTLTVPLVVLPPLYARLAHEPLIPQRYLPASLFVLVASAIGHLVLYGTDTRYFIGVRNIIFPVGSFPSRIRAFSSEIAYALVHFGSIVLVYRVVTESRLGPLDATVFVPVLTSALVWLSSVCIFIFVYPESVTVKDGMMLRGVLNGLMLSITLIGGMLM